MGIVLVFASSLLCFLSAASSAEIDRTDGGYKDIHVSINKDIPYEESIIENIKALFRSSSQFLHQATNGRVYFKEVSIELPHTWPKRASAEELSESIYQKSDVRIEMPVKGHGDKPFTSNPNRCGHPGHFIQLTPGFLAQTQNATARSTVPPAYVFVHEWAHFRYGVFDEYGSVGDKEYPITYCHNSKVLINACSERLQFHAEAPDGGPCTIDGNCGLTEEACVITIAKPEGAPVDSSIMFMPYLANLSKFCDNNDTLRLHNEFAPSKQNALCNQRSTWEVISGNDDFKALPTPDMSKRIHVKFQEKQKKNDLGPRTVLVLDVSERMGANNRLKLMKVAVTRYVTDIQDDSQRLAIVTFSNDAKVLQPLMAVNVSTRQEFLRKVATIHTESSTCIGCGLERALELLNTTTEKPEGAMIILVTDGTENRHPNISTLKLKVKESKVTVNTFALGVSADERLEDLAMATNGRAYSSGGLTGDIALELDNAFASSTSTQLDDEQQPVTLEQVIETFRNKLERKFLIDGGVGNGTVVIIDTIKSRPLNFTKAWLVDPSGKACQECKQRSDKFGTVISIPSPAKVGTWTLHFETGSPDEITVTIQVKSRGDEPIRVFCKVGKMKVNEPAQATVLARVAKGKQVVLNAVVQAVVTVSTAYGKTHKSAFQLHDNGGGEPDTQADDGWYTGYFTEFVGKGRYSVSAYVSSQDGTRLADSLEGSGSFSSRRNLTVVFDPQHTGFDTAHPIGDFIYVDEDDPDLNKTRVVEEVNITRISEGGSFNLLVNISEEDLPPAKIRNLRAFGLQPGSSDKTHLVKLTWTWPGAHLTSGKASGVTIRASQDSKSLISSFDSQTEITNDSVVDGNLEPLPSGAKHAVTVALPATFRTLRSDGKYDWKAYIAVRVTNSYGKSSNISNVVDASYTPPGVTTVESVTTKTAATKTTKGSATSKTKTAAPTTTKRSATSKTKTAAPAKTKGSATSKTKTAAPATTKGSATSKTTADKEDEESSNGGSSVWPWIGIVIGAAVVVAIIVVALRNRNKTDILDEGRQEETVTNVGV
ncbi:calcium-activated chloride channel regulator 3A-1-like [Haemaphysalis longicornis]